MKDKIEEMIAFLIISIVYTLREIPCKNKVVAIVGSAASINLACFSSSGYDEYMPYFLGLVRHVSFVLGP